MSGGPEYCAMKWPKNKTKQETPKVELKDTICGQMEQIIRDLRDINKLIKDITK